MTVLSNTDALLVAVPMIGLLVVVHFRLDELVGKPRKSRRPVLSGRPFSGIAGEVEPSAQLGGGIGKDKLPAERGPRVRAERD